MKRNSKLTASFLLALVVASHPILGYGQKLSPVHIGVPTNTVTWFPLYVAWKKGMFQEQGLDVLPVTMSVRASLGALAAKHISYITPLGSSMTAISHGLQAKVIMIFAVRSHHVLVTKREIANPQDLRGRTVAISQPGGTVHRQLVKILEHFGVNAKDVKVINLGEMPNRAMVLKTGNIDGAMLSIPYDLFMEKDDFKPLAYLKDISEFPLLGLIAHDDRIRERPEEVKRVLIAALKGIAYTKINRQEVLPLLQQFIGLPTLEMTDKTYDAIKGLWPDDGMPSEKGLATALSMADVPPTFPASKIVDWSLVAAASAALKSR